MLCFIIRILSLGAVLFFARPSFAELKEFPDFSIDLPPGWTVKEEGITTAFLAKDHSALMLVTVDSITNAFKEGMDAQELAQAYAEELKGSEPVMEGNDANYYSFTFISPDNLKSEASIVVSGRRFYLLTISGKHKDLAHMAESVLLSLP